MSLTLTSLSCSGKTLAFVVPLLNKIIKSGSVVKEKRVFGIIISPTQELALQTDAVVKQFSEHIPHVKTCLFVGGRYYTFPYFISLDCEGRLHYS